MDFLEIVDETNKGYDKLIRPLAKEFFSDINLPALESKKVIIKVPLNFDAEYFNNSSLEQQKNIQEHGILHHALTAIPTDENYSEFIVLFKEDVFIGYQHFNTIFHELTHVLDFINYFNDYGNVFIKDEFAKVNTYYYEFYFWTEFHAKKQGLKRFKIELDKNGYQMNLEQTATNFIQDVLTQEVQFLNLYELVHFFARISLYEVDGLSSLNSEIFPMDFIIKEFGTSSIDLYNLFQKSSSYENFKTNKFQIKLLIDNIL